ncbi:MAG: DUF2782 domain-containing protein [Burkholderiales bacterium]
MLTRLFIVGLLLAVTLPVAAQQGKPPALQPLPEPPPPPPGYELDAALEPQVTILKRGTDTVEEYRIGGRLYMIKITPAGGRPYYLVDNHGAGNFVRYDNYDSGLRPPMWVILQF